MSSRKLKVLLAEDNPADAELVLRQLRRAGFDFEVVCVEREAEFSEALHADVDLVLSDYELNGFNGFRALEIVQERGLEIPFVLVSGTIGEDLAVEAIKRGASDYLLKDRLARLGMAVTHALEEVRLRRERKKQDASLRLFRALLDQSTDTFEIIDPETGRFLDVSESSCRTLGYTREEHLRLHAADVDSGVNERGWKSIAAELRERGFASGESMHRRKDGTTFPVEYNARWVRLDRDYIVSVVRDITDRKKVEKMLMDRERSLAMAQRIAHIGSWELDLSNLDDIASNPLRCSDEFYRVFGYEPGAIDPSNDTFLQRVPLEDREKIGRGLREAIRTGNIFSLDHRIIRSDGTERIIHERGDLVRDEKTGKPFAMVGTAQDVTERRRMDIALRQSREDFRLLFEANPMPMWVHDRETLKFLAVNEAAIRHYGFSFEEFLGMTIKEILPEEDVPALMDAITSPTHTGGAAGAWRHRKKNGEIAYMEIVFHLFTFQGRPAELILANDVTVQRENVLALRESETRFRQLAENINEVFWMTDPAKTKTLYVSPAYEVIWGRSRERLYQNPTEWLDAIHPEDRDRVVHALVRQARGDYQETFRIVRPDGSFRWVRDRAFPIKDAGGNVYRLVGTSEDITEHRRLEDQFRQAQKLEAIGTLAGGIAHDFNNILGAIIGYAELSKLDMKPGAPAQQYLDMVLQGAHRAAALVRQILAFSRQQEQQRVPLQLKHAVEEPLKLLRATIPAIIEFDVSFEEDLPVVLADPTQVHQMVMNLCTNAAFAMGDRPGRLGVKLERYVVGGEQPEIGMQLAPGPYVRLTISDTGCGMDRSTLERIFEPFFTTKGPGEGTGLGLSVVHGIMQTHEGAVTVQSHPGEGSEFHLYFPADLSVFPPIESPKTEAVPRGSGERVLVIEDELSIGQLAESILGLLNYRAVAMTDALEALEHVQAEPQAYDLVLTDLSMPRMMGTEVASRLLAIRPDLPIILTTGYTTTLNTDAVHAMGIRGLLSKPFSFHSLGAAVHDALRTNDR